MALQSEQEGADTQPWEAQALHGGGEATSLDFVGSVCEDAQYPVAECSAQVQSAMFYQFDGENVLNAGLKSMSSILM